MIRPEIPEGFIPQLTYYPILVNEISTETLLRIRNAVAAVFYVENSNPQTLDELMAILSDEAPQQFEIFGRWLRNYLAGTAGEAAVVGPIRSVWEVKSIFATKLQECGERLKEEAREEGRLKGRQEGRQEGRRETARVMIERGIDVEMIADVTGLSPEEIAAL